MHSCASRQQNVLIVALDFRILGEQRGRGKKTSFVERARACLSKRAAIEENGQRYNDSQHSNVYGPDQPKEAEGIRGQPCSLTFGEHQTFIHLLFSF